MLTLNYSVLRYPTNTEKWEDFKFTAQTMDEINNKKVLVKAKNHGGIVVFEDIEITET